MSTGLGLLMAYAVLLALAVVAPVGWSTTASAAAQEPFVQVELDAITPTVASPGTEVRLSGSITNAGTQPVAVHSVRVSTAYRGLDTREAVQSWAADGSLRTPIRLAEDHIEATVAPGSRVRFFTDVPPDQLRPGFSFATLPVRIEVIAAAGQDADGTDDGAGTTGPQPGSDDALPGSELRTFLPWQVAEDADFNPIDLAWVAPLTLPAGPGLVSTDNAVRAAAWSEVIGPRSRTAALLEGLAGSRATFVVDPALLEPLDPLASLTEGIAGEPVQPESTPTSDAEPTGPEEVPAQTGSGPRPPSPASATSTPEPGTTGPADADAGSATEQPGLAPGGADNTGQTTGVVEQPEDEPGPATPSTPPLTEEAVADLRDRIAEVPDAQLWWLPVSDTDVGALQDLGSEPADIAALVGRMPAQSLPAAGRTDVAWPLSEAFSNADIQGLSRVWAEAGGATGAVGAGDGTLRGVVLPGEAVADGPMTGSAVRPHTSGPLLIGYDERLSGIVAAAGGPEQDGRAVQRFLAETMAIYQQQPAVDRSVVVAIPRDAEPDAATLRDLTAAARSAPWLASRTVSELMEGAEALEPVAVSLATGSGGDGEGAGEDSGLVPGIGDLAAYSRPDPSPLTPHRISRVEDLRTKVVGASQIVPGSEEAADTWLGVLDRQYSARWRQDGQLWAEPVDHATAVATEILTGLQINPTTINFWADEGLIRITVTNDLPVAVEGLQMTVAPGNARLRILGQPEPITIGPQSRATVQFRAQAVAAGQVPLNTSLSTPNGTLVGEIEKTQVRAQPTSVWIYWLLGGVAGVILVLGLVRALRPGGTRRVTAGESVETPGSDLETA